MTWTAVVLAVASPTVTLAIAVWGFRRTTRSDRLKMFLDLQENYLSDLARTGRRLIHQQLAGLDSSGIAALTDDHCAHVDRTLAVMNTLAIACEGGQVEFDMVVKAMGRSYASTVNAAVPYIQHQTSVRGYAPYQYAVRLAARILAATGPPNQQRRTQALH